MVSVVEPCLVEYIRFRNAACNQLSSLRAAILRLQKGDEKKQEMLEWRIALFFRRGLAKELSASLCN